MTGIHTPTAGSTLDAFPWTAMENCLADQVVAAVRDFAAAVPDERVRAAAVSDLYARNMLVLWPCIAVSSSAFRDRDDSADSHRWNVDSWKWHTGISVEGDLWAERLTSFAGRSGSSWSHVSDCYRRAIVAASRIATRILVSTGTVDADFVTIAYDPGNPAELVQQCLTPEQLRRHFPRLHHQVTTEQALRRLPPSKQISALIGILDDDTAGHDLHRRAHAMLAEFGEPAGIALAEHLSVSDRADELEPAHSARLFSALDATRACHTLVIDRLLESAGNLLATNIFRASAMTSLCLLGHAQSILHLLDQLPDELACDALGAPYLTDRVVGTLDYRRLEAILMKRPRYDELLFARLTPTRVHSISSSDLPTATAALSSRSRFIRRHAAIVLLSAHL